MTKHTTEKNRTVLIVIAAALIIMFLISPLSVSEEELIEKEVIETEDKDITGEIITKDGRIGGSLQIFEEDITTDISVENIKDIKINDKDNILTFKIDQSSKLNIKVDGETLYNLKNIQGELTVIYDNKAKSLKVSPAKDGGFDLDGTKFSAKEAGKEVIIYEDKITLPRGIDYRNEETDAVIKSWQIGVDVTIYEKEMSHEELPAAAIAIWRDQEGLHANAKGAVYAELQDETFSYKGLFDSMWSFTHKPDNKVDIILKDLSEKPGSTAKAGPFRVGINKEGRINVLSNEELVKAENLMLDKELNLLYAIKLNVESAQRSRSFEINKIDKSWVRRILRKYFGVGKSGWIELRSDGKSWVSGKVKEKEYIPIPIEAQPPEPPKPLLLKEFIEGLERIYGKLEYVEKVREDEYTYRDKANNYYKIYKDEKKFWRKEKIKEL